MLKIYVGYDPRDEMAMRACVASISRYASIPVDIIMLRENELRKRGIYWRGYRVNGNGQMIDDRDGRPFSTQFSFTRFAVPLLDKSPGWVMFCDADMLFRRDVAELIALAEHDKAIMCVQHNHMPPETTKMDGMIQTHYKRKNWSSLMLMRPENVTITKYWLNNESGSFLHALCFQDDATIGALPEQWNWLEGWSSPDIDPAVVHYTRGTPDMVGDDLPYADDWWKAVDAWRPYMCRSLDWHYGA